MPARPGVRIVTALSSKVATQPKASPAATSICRVVRPSAGVSVPVEEGISGAMSSVSRQIVRFMQWFRMQTDVRRAALMGIGFGLVLCVVMFISILLLSWIGTLGK